MKKSALKSDRFKKARGGHSRLLDIRCAACGERVCLYQKDGTGSLKRLYIDRMQGWTKSTQNLTCVGCAKRLGILTIYKKEHRSVYRLLQGAVAKHVTH